MLRAPALLIALVAAPVPAMALTGAELLQTKRDFGIGYVWGAIEASSDVPYGVEMMKLFEHRTDCLVDAKISSGTAYDGVAAKIRNTPSLLGAPAARAVVEFLFDMCGAPK